ncbi:MAG: mechanosensitive ion channel family protein [Mogibacterium sp.]|nr:mechanosensitive ion channel family protein [Mogibacterium sp.]
MDVNISNWERLLEKISDGAMNIGLKLLLAILVYLVGSFIIKRIIKGLKKLRSLKSIDPTAEEYIMTFIKAALYVVLVVSIVALLGVPMSSVIAAIASVGVAIGLALQGALSNIAGGIMLLIFRPFSVGDYISTGSEEGTVRSISLVYTVLTTVDNRRVSVPNGSLMNSSISNASAEPLRRVDLNFDIAGSEDADRVEGIMKDVIARSEKAKSEPAPQVLITAGVPGGLTYTVRVWVKTADYWDEFAYLMKEIPAALNAENIARPATPVSVSK